MTWLNNLTLQKRIGLIVLVGLVVGLSLFSWLGIQAVNESVQRTLQQRLILAQVMAKQLDENITHILTHLRNAANFNGGLPGGEQFGETADSLRASLAQSGLFVRYVILVGQEGAALRVVPENDGIIGTDMSDYPTVASALGRGAPTISNLVANPLFGTPVLLVSAPVFNEDNIIGALAIVVDIEQSTISSSTQTVTLGKTGYTELVDGNGLVLARTTPALPPNELEQSDHPGRFSDLIRQGTAIVRTCHRCHETPKALERRRDVLAFAPLSRTSWGVAIRQAEEEALAPTLQLRERLLALGLIVVLTTFLLVWAMMQGVVKPIRMLTSTVKRVAAGDFRAVSPFRRRDEIGQLSSAFYSMTQELAKSRQELTKSRDELVVRNEELSALNSIAGTVNQSLNLEDVLGNTMQKVLEVTRTNTGCVFLRSPDDSRLEIMGGIDPLKFFRCQQYGLASPNCACHRVLRNGQTLMVNDVSQCPMLTQDVVATGEITSFVSVPLKSKDRTLGIMNIACSEERCFTENDFRILDSIAHHLGLALENSALFEEAKQKEELRGQLLSRIINAQEEERKRIARELHDDYGQSLAALKLNLEALESTGSAARVELREKLREAGALVATALENLRRLTLDLRPYALDQLGLVAAIRAYTNTHLVAKGILVDFKTRGLNRRLSPEIETVLFRIVQEAIHNITRHAEARNVRIQLEAEEDKVTASIEDDGKGFDVDTVFRSKIGTQSLGLLGIQERVTLLGGSFSIVSQPGQGTHLVVEIPPTIVPSESPVS